MALSNAERQARFRLRQAALKERYVTGSRQASPSTPDVLLELVRELARKMCTPDEICAVLRSPSYEGRNAQKARRGEGPKFQAHRSRGVAEIERDAVYAT
jgi:hypothetical protein